MKTVPILFTFDQSLELAAGVCLTSLLESAEASTFYDIFVLHGPGCDFSGSRLNALPERYGNCRLRFRKVEGEFVGGYEVRGIPETAYYRLLSPELIPEYDKILYSDVDVIIREDLSRYYEMDLGENYFAGVDNGSRLRPAFRKYITDTLRKAIITRETLSSTPPCFALAASSKRSAASEKTPTCTRTWTSSTLPATAVSFPSGPLSA